MALVHTPRRFVLFSFSALDENNFLLNYFFFKKYILFIIIITVF